MKKPSELRQLAARSHERAQKIYDAKKVSDADDFTPAELAEYDAHRSEASKYLDQAETQERREKDLNDFDARLRSQAPTGPDGVPLDADRFDREIATRPYSLMRVLRNRAESRPLDGWEYEVSQEIARRTGKPAEGFYLPMDLPFDRRAAARGAKSLGYRLRADVTTASAASLYPTITQPNTIIELLRNKCAMLSAGAQLLTGLTGPLTIPRQNSSAGWSWVNENAAPSLSALGTDGVTLTPRTGTVSTKITRRMLQQITLDIEMLVRDDIVASAAVGIDTAAIKGAIAGPQLSPIGILNIAAVPTVAIGTNGGPLTFANVVALETAVASANADINECVYFTNSKVVGHAKQQPKIGSTYPIYIMADDRTMNGHATLVTNVVPSDGTKGSGTNLSALIYGDFSQSIIGMWGGLDVLANPYGDAVAGGLLIHGFQDVDFVLRHPESFAKIVDITA